MVANKNTSFTSGNDSALVGLLIGAVVVLVALLLAGGYWMQKQRTSDAQLRQQANIYDNYLHQTRPSQQAVELPRSFVEAQQTRQQLLAHPAVTPGVGFDMPGVQSTGKVIVDAIDQAKGL